MTDRPTDSGESPDGQRRGAAGSDAPETPTTADTRDTMTDESESTDETAAQHDERNTDGTDTLTLSRRAALTSLGLAGLFGLGTGTASADARGQVGTEDDPLEALYTEELRGGITDDQTLTDLAGAGLSIDSGSLDSLWTESDTDGVVETGADYDGIDVSTATVDGLTLADGTATDPALTFADDSDTGLYRQGDGSLAVTTNGSDALLVDDFEVSVRNNILAADSLDVGDIFANGFETNTSETRIQDIRVQRRDVFGIERLETARIRGSWDLTIEANGRRALVLGEPDESVDGNGVGDTSPTPNVVAGHATNNTDGATPRGIAIGGGGAEGNSNVVSASFGTVSGGLNNAAESDYATVGGGIDNRATGQNATVGGGEDNLAGGNSATVGGGVNNEVTSGDSTIAGGNGNEANGQYSAIGGGSGNYTGDTYAAVSGGDGNQATGSYAMIPGGAGNAASGDYSFAAGRKAYTFQSGTSHDGSFVWGDSSDTVVESSANDQVVFQAGGTRTSGTAVEFYSQSNGSAGVKLAANDGTWQSLSSRAAKTDIDPVTGPDVLDTVEQLEISTWRYEGQDESVRHIGPMAEEFHDAFGLGTDEETIAALDTAGVALAAIQGLAQRLDDKDDRIDELESETEQLREETDELRDENESLHEENDRLRERNAELEARLDRIETYLGIDAADQQGVADD